jgi:hypothetical protein
LSKEGEEEKVFVKRMCSFVFIGFSGLPRFSVCVCVCVFGPSFYRFVAKWYGTLIFFLGKEEEAMEREESRGIAETRCQLHVANYPEAPLPFSLVKTNNVRSFLSCVP